MTIIGITFLIAVIIIIGTDIYLAIKGGFQATLSYWMMLNSIKYPIMPAMLGFGIGLLFGHFFWDQVLNVSVPCPVSK